jgi:hypothetical protein
MRRGRGSGGELSVGEAPFVAKCVAKDRTANNSSGKRGVAQTNWDIARSCVNVCWMKGECIAGMALQQSSLGP